MRNEYKRQRPTEADPKRRSRRSDAFYSLGILIYS